MARPLLMATNISGHRRHHLRHCWRPFLLSSLFLLLWCTTTTIVATVSAATAETDTNNNNDLVSQFDALSVFTTDNVEQQQQFIASSSAKESISSNTQLEGDDRPALQQFTAPLPLPDEASEVEVEPFSASATPSLSSSLLNKLSTTYTSSKSTSGFMFNIAARANKNSDSSSTNNNLLPKIILYGLDINVVNSAYIKNGPSFPVLVYTKPGSYEGYETLSNDWTLWINTTIVSEGLDEATSVPQNVEDVAIPIVLDPTVTTTGDGGERAFYVSCPTGPYLRYSEVNFDQLEYTTTTTNNNNNNEDGGAGSGLTIYSMGSSKRKGWSGSTLSPRLFNGGLHYYTADANNINFDLVQQQQDGGIQLLPNQIISNEPTLSPVVSPTQSPTTNKPTGNPTTQKPTVSIKPTVKSTLKPTSAPVEYSTFETIMEDASVKPVLVYAGCMFDIKARSNNIEVSSLAFNTYWTEPLDVSLYIITNGSYKGNEDTLKKWTWWGNVTVTGAGMGNPTILPKRSFEPILLRESQTLSIYMATNGPYLRMTKGEVEGRPFTANEDLVIYEGVGKRHPITAGTISPRIFNGHIGYETVTIPTPSPTIDTSNLWVAETIFRPVADTFIQEGVNEPKGLKAQMMIDGNPNRVSLLQFDIRKLKINTIHAPTQILSVKLRLYSMTSSDFGGYVHLIRDGKVDEGTTIWENVPYGQDTIGEYVGQFRSVWKYKSYDLDITEMFRGDDVPDEFILHISSDRENGAIYRSSDGSSNTNGPQLIVNFAYDSDTNKALAKLYGSDPPTQAPTVKPEWENSVIPPNPPNGRRYFNYHPRSRYGPWEWDNIQSDGEYDRLKRLHIDTNRNRCMSGSRQSPQDICETNDKCLEFHQPRSRAGQYGLGSRTATVARPMPKIMHNKLRLQYQERMSEMQMPIPPGCDFARNGFQSGVQDLVHIDVKVTSEHTICGKRYDAEMQQFYLHREGNLEAIAVLINAGGEHNDHFEVLLQFFQQKFDADVRLCEMRQQRARSLLESRRRRGDEDPSDSSMLRGGGTMEEEVSIELEEEEEYDGESPSIGNAIYQTIRHRLLNMASQRREARMEKWNPLKSWDVMKTVHFWAYSGSLTEPPCSEGVNWRILDVPMEISSTQYFRLKRLMFDHVDPDTCAKTSSHFEESNARPTQQNSGGARYRCRRSDYASDMERQECGRVKGCVLENKWWGVDNFPYVTPEFPTV